MSLKTEIHEALSRSADHEALTAIVRRFYAAGGTKDQAYETLQEIWLESGYNQDDGSQPDARRDELEYVMERVWYWGL